MINYCLNSKKDFGIIYQNKESQSKIGCSVSIEKIINKYSDGRMDLIVRGKRIFKIQSQSHQNDIAIGDISYLKEPEPLNRKIFNPL